MWTEKFDDWEVWQQVTQIQIKFDREKTGFDLLPR